MKKSSYFIPIFLILLSISTAHGFAGMGVNNPNSTVSPLSGLTNTTDSDQDIVLLQHLIEIDAVRFQAQNKLAIKETLIFKNIGAKNFSGTLRTWVPDNVENISIGKVAMTQDAFIEPVQVIQNGNIVSWSAAMGINSLPPLFSVEYVQDAKPQGTVSKVQTYSKKLIFPTLINYRYTDRPDLPAVVIKVTKSVDSSITFLDENRNKLSTPDVSEDGNSIISRFSEPQFKELNIQISKSAGASGIVVYVIIGIAILLIISYPVLRKKSEKLQAFEDKIKNSLKREPGTEEQPAEETEEIAEEEQIEEVSEDDEDVSGKTNEGLEEEKNDLISKLNKLEKDYSAGDILDEEYEELKSSYKTRIGKINARLKQSK